MVARHTAGPRLAAFAALVVLAATALMLGTTTARAADGVRVIPEAALGDNRWQYGADVNGSFVAFVQGINPYSDDATIQLASLLRDDAPTQLSVSDPSQAKAMMPRILVNGDTVTVVWTEVDLRAFDSDLWIWQGTYDAGSGAFTPTAGFPKVLVRGTVYDFAGAPTASTQQNSALGLVHHSDGGDQLVVAWEDSRDNGPWAPLIYVANLSADGAYLDEGWAASDGPDALGWPIDPTDLPARGQHAPDVGHSGVYWLDDRWSFWNEGVLTDTAVWRAVPGADGWTTAAFFADTNHSYDDGLAEQPGGGPRVTGTGAAWLRSGPYGGADKYQPFMKSTTSTGKTVSPMTRPVQVDASYQPGLTATGLALLGAHLDRTDAADLDVFFYDPATLQRVPVCDRGNAAGTDPDATPGYWRFQQQDAAIGPAPGGGYRVVWSDNRDAAADAEEDSADSRLYQAFVPAVSARASAATIRLGSRVTVTAAVKPGFAGAKARLQRVKASTRYGATIYTPVTWTLSGTKTLGAGSTASWSIRPSARGTYLVRIHFYGGARYYTDGATTQPSPSSVPVPHVANCSKVLKIVVK